MILKAMPFTFIVTLAFPALRPLILTVEVFFEVVVTLATVFFDVE